MLHLKDSHITKIGLFVLIAIHTLFSSSCRRDRADYVPYVPVDLVLGLQTDLVSLGVGETAIIIPIETNKAGLIKFSAPGLPEIRIAQSVYGNGLILYNAGLDEYGRQEYRVYDRTCTFNAEVDYCALEIDETGLLPDCPCCSSKFNIPSFGDVQKGPASLPLQPYRAVVSSGSLFITND